MPSPEQLAIYAALGGLTVLELIDWPGRPRVGVGSTVVSRRLADLKAREELAEAIRTGKHARPENTGHQPCDDHAPKPTGKATGAKPTATKSTPGSTCRQERREESSSQIGPRQGARRRPRRLRSQPDTGSATTGCPEDGNPRRTPRRQQCGRALTRGHTGRWVRSAAATARSAQPRDHRHVGGGRNRPG